MGTPIKTLDGLQWTSEDLQKKFHGAFVLASIEKPGLKGEFTPPEVYQIHEPALDGGKIAFAGKDKKNRTVQHRAFYLEDDRPSPCITNVGDTALIFRYNPERQWRRGVGTYNCYFYWAPTFSTKKQKSFTPPGPGIHTLSNTFAAAAPSFDEMYYDDEAPSTGGLTFEAVEAIYFPKHSKFEEALEELLANKAKGRAINNKYSLVRLSPRDSVRLYRGRTLMGSFMGSKFFSMEDAGRLFAPEIHKELPILREKYAFRSKPQ